MTRSASILWSRTSIFDFILMMMTFIYVLALFFLLVLVFFFRRFIYERDDDGESEKSDTGNTFLFKLGTQPNRNKDINYKKYFLLRNDSIFVCFKLTRWWINWPVESWNSRPKIIGSHLNCMLDVASLKSCDYLGYRLRASRLNCQFGPTWEGRRLQITSEH